MARPGTSEGHGDTGDHLAAPRPRRPRAAASVAGSGLHGPYPFATTEAGSGAGGDEALATRSIYRVLLMQGLAPDEAANLTAFVCGIPVAQVRWSLRQVNQLLFLREMARTRAVRRRRRGSARPH